MLNFCDFIQVYVFTTNHHLKMKMIDGMGCDVHPNFLKYKISVV